MASIRGSPPFLRSVPTSTECPRSSRAPLNEIVADPIARSAHVRSRRLDGKSGVMRVLRSEASNKGLDSACVHEIQYLERACGLVQSDPAEVTRRSFRLGVAGLPNHPHEATGVPITSSGTTTSGRGAGVFHWSRQRGTEVPSFPVNSARRLSPRLAQAVDLAAVCAKHVANGS